MRNLLLSVFLFSASLVFSQYQLEWLTVPPIENGRMLWIDDAVTDDKGNCYVRLYKGQKEARTYSHPQKTIARIDDRGNKLWETYFEDGNVSEACYAKLLVLRNNMIYTFTCRNDTLRIYKIDTNGVPTVIYSHPFPWLGIEGSSSTITTGYDNHLYVCNIGALSGKYIIELDENDALVRLLQLPLTHHAAFDYHFQGIAPNGNIYLTYQEPDTLNIKHMHMVAYARNNSIVWDSVLYTGTDYINRVIADSSGYLYINTPGVISKYDSAHNQLWSYSYNPVYYPAFFRLSDDGEVFLILQSPAGTAFRLIRLSTGGNQRFNISLPMVCDLNSFQYRVDEQKRTTLVNLIPRGYPEDYTPYTVPYEVATIVTVDSSGGIIGNLRDTLYYPIRHAIGSMSKITIDKTGDININYRFHNPQTWWNDSSQSAKQDMWYTARYCRNCKDNIKGTVGVDTIANCQLDNSEPRLRGAMLKLNPSERYSFTNDRGSYRFTPGDTGSYTIQVFPPEYMTALCDTEAVVTVLNPGTTTGANFVLTGNSSCNGRLEIAATRARYGFNQCITIRYENTGYPNMNGTVALTLANDFQMDTAVPAYDYAIGNTYYWDYSNLRTMDVRQIFVVTTVWSVLTTSYTHNVQLSTGCTQGVTALNDSLNDIVFGAFDPNDKTIYPLEVRQHNAFLSPMEPLTYQINFQNTGNDTAFRVLLRDTISPDLDLSSFTMLAASHAYEVNMVGERGVEWVFKNILLPDSTTNEPRSHGFVKFSIKPRPGIPLNTTIYNRAAIYFDFNEPIFTNTLGTQYVTSYTGIEETEEVFFSVSPNPNTGYLLLNNPMALSADLVVLDVTGKQVRQYSIAPSLQSALDVSDLQSGVYFVRVISQNAKKVSIIKMVKL